MKKTHSNSPLMEARILGEVADDDLVAGSGCDVTPCASVCVCVCLLT